MKCQVLHTMWCNTSGEAAEESWNWSPIACERVNALGQEVVEALFSDTIQSFLNRRTAPFFITLSRSGLKGLEVHSPSIGGGGGGEANMSWIRVIGQSSPQLLTRIEGGSVLLLPLFFMRLNETSTRDVTGQRYEPPLLHGQTPWALFVVKHFYNIACWAYCTTHPSTSR